MLELLRIHNLALIEDLAMDFAPGMNVLTGETGAGKSFILKALNFLTGDKLDTDLVRPGKEKAVVEALFRGENGEDMILRRELAADSGRSRIYLNDRLCSQETVRELRPGLILHSSQHGQQKLLQPAFQAAILDAHLNRPDLIEKKDGLSKALAAMGARLKSLEQSRLALEDKRDVLEYQQKEIAKVAPKIGEEEALEAKRALARNQTAVADQARAALEALHGQGEGGLLPALNSLEKAVGALAALLEEYSPHTEKLAEMRIALADLEAGLRKSARQAGQEADIEALEERLYALAQLKRKLKRPLEAILDLQREIEENLAFLDNCALEHKELRQEEAELCAALAAVLAELNPARQSAALALSSALQEELKGLGFSEHVRVIFEFSPLSLYAGRQDLTELRARLFWQPNPGQPPQALDRIASGGELSRFLLAVVSLMSKNTEEKPSLIFDEVDSGVGGLTLNRVADSLAALAASRQMLLITHWPQLAARADRHFVVSKEVRQGETYTLCSRLDAEEIPGELARMSGSEKT
ncbi:AAA family ATPase [Desulfovibrio sp. OttesenSCG-928-G11]|nr:AAA family ATPase [Desulfovibrio sp. OttesenSCG-928-G11]